MSGKTSEFVIATSIAVFLISFVGIIMPYWLSMPRELCSGHTHIGRIENDALFLEELGLPEDQAIHCIISESYRAYFILVTGDCSSDLRGRLAQGGTSVAISEDSKRSLVDRISTLFGDEGTAITGHIETGGECFDFRNGCIIINRSNSRFIVQFTLDNGQWQQIDHVKRELSGRSQLTIN